MGAITSIIAGVSLASTAAGTGLQYEGSRRAASEQGDITGLELKAEAQRRKAMELDARRRMLENIRIQQRARSQALTNASNQGAELSSGLQGGYGQIGGQTETNQLGIFQNLSIGENLFDINSQISTHKINLANAQSMSALGAGLTNLGTGLLSVMPQIKSLAGGFNPSVGSPYQGNPTRLGQLY